GIFIDGSSHNTIGGATPAARNVISGHPGTGFGTLGDGVEVAGLGTADNQIVGNFIGTNAAGTAALPNVEGLEIYYDGVLRTTIRGNLLSGNTDGIDLYGDG